MSSRAQWLANLDGMRDFCTPVVVELWGHGRSPIPADPALLTPDAYIDQFEMIRAELGVDKWRILGQSFGAGLTLRYALERPEAIIAQAWCNSNSAFEDRSDPTLNQRGQKLRAALESGVPLRDLPMHPAHGKRLPPAVRDALIADADQLDVPSLIKSLAITRADLSVRERFCETTPPTLLLNGIFEKSFQPTAALALKELPALKIAPLEGGHAVNAEAAQAFNAALEAIF